MTTDIYELPLYLGKKPAREGAYRFKLRRFLTKGLSPAPAVFGHTDAIHNFGMLGNDQAGDCVWAGGDHETMIWTGEVGTPAVFTTANALADYSAATGYDPRNPSTDQGTDMEEAAKYRRKVGLIDAAGKRHKIDAYLALPGVSATGRNNSTLPNSIANAAYHFGGVGIGIEFPESAMDQFNLNQPWSVVPNSPLQGGHYVPLVGRRANGNFVVVTWGKLQEVTPLFLTTYVDEAVVYVSIERLKEGKSLEGFDLATLQADLAALGGTTPTPVPVPTPTPVVDPNVALLNKWAAATHVGKTAAAARAWQQVQKEYNL